jgi:hypothetical protein
MENQNPTTPGPVGQVPTELNPQQAISVLIQAVNFAQSKGVYSLEDAEILSKAVKVFVKKEDKPAAEVPAAEVPAQPEGTPASN